jgi:hypothetical protein
MQNSPGSLSRLQVVGLNWAISSAARTEGRKSRGGSGLRLGPKATVGRKGEEKGNPFSFSENIFVKKNIVGIAR